MTAAHITARVHRSPNRTRRGGQSGQPGPVHPLRFRPPGSSGPPEISVPAIPEPHPLDDSSLPKAGPLRVDDVELGPGRPVEAVRPCLASSGPSRSRLWMSDAAVPDAALIWRRLVDRFPQTGLWPLVLHSLAGDGRQPAVGRR